MPELSWNVGYPLAILVMVLADQRFGPDNWAEVDISDDDLVADFNSWPLRQRDQRGR